MRTISIIIPIYNVEDYIVRCVNSVLNQSNVNIEIILINDGSTDNSGSICDKYAEDDARIRVIHQTNAGVSAARNEGIKNSKGEWICFIDADDWIEADSLGKIINNSYNDGMELLIARSFKRERERENLKNELYNFDYKNIGHIFNGIELAINNNYLRGSVWGVLYNRKFLLQHDIYFPYGLKNREDTIFFSICCIYAKKVGFLDIDFYNAYDREDSASRNWTFDRVLYITNNIQYLIKYMKSHADLSLEALNILNYNIYGDISYMYNKFYNCFSFRNYFILKKELKKELKIKIDTGKIKSCQNKVNILNLSIDLFAVSVLTKCFILNLKSIS